MSGALFFTFLTVPPSQSPTPTSDMSMVNLIGKIQAHPGNESSWAPLKSRVGKGENIPPKSQRAKPVLLCTIINSISVPNKTISVLVLQLYMKT